ncbi:PhnD/SsuA/transferrin family substrate-binding protein [Malonomonas rubra]|uniref:PhnD/SsuA/transferrin family substrate-binding protein n=1 Tax=Malonomonas rubra TaxID=57040 RepID=UPI001ABEF037|nr:PhnD/SsuA/transferrin family substrate-binding protein [Malonomonas rubra]
MGGKRIWQISLFVALQLLVLLCASSLFAAGAVRFAPQPMESKDAIRQQFQPFSRFLAANLRTEVKLLHHRNYRTLIEGLWNDSVDLAYLGPLPYVLAQQQDPDIVPLARFVNAEGDSTYTCALASFGPKLDVTQISSETPIVLTQPYSTCGYLLTAHQLRSFGKNLEELPYYYAGNHSEAALDVIRGKASLAGVKTPVAKQYRHLGLHFREDSILLPGHLLVANKRTLSAEQIKVLRTALLALRPRTDLKDRELTAEWGVEFRYGAIPVHPDDYAEINKLLLQIKVPGVNE